MSLRSGLDSSHYQNFATTDDDVICYFANGELLPPLAGAGAGQVHVCPSSEKT